MQYYLLSFLLLLAVNGDKQFSIDSDEVDGSTFGGMVVLVQSDDKDEPEIVMSSNVDGYSKVYCLTLEEMFEANSYVTAFTDEKYGDHDEQSNSEIDFQGDVEWTYTRGTEGKSFVLDGVAPSQPATSDNGNGTTTTATTGNFASMEFVFEVATAVDDVNSYGLKYSFQLNGYEWVSTDPNAKLVLVMELKKCADEFVTGDFSAEEVDEQDEEDEVDDETRRLGDEDAQDSDGVSDDGVSSDDSNELDIETLRFVNTPVAACMENGEVTTTQIATNLVYGASLSSDEMHIVFDHFDCDLFQDPWWGQDSSKTDSGVERMHLYVVVISLILCLCFVW